MRHAASINRASDPRKGVTQKELIEIHNLFSYRGQLDTLFVLACAASSKNVHTVNVYIAEAFLAAARTTAKEVTYDSQDSLMKITCSNPPRPRA